MRRSGPALAAVLLLAAACTGTPNPASAPRTHRTPAPPPTGGGSASPASTAEPIPKSLCQPPPPPTASPTRSPGVAPAAITLVERQVEQARHLTFLHPVAPEPVTQARIGELIRQANDQALPEDLWRRRSQVWATIGLVPAGTDLRRSIIDYAGNQVIGFYDDRTKRLVFIGSSSPSAFERVTLSHELTHALDDQRFGLARLDRLGAACRDDAADAFLSLAEGDAVVTSLAWARQNLSVLELLGLGREAAAAPPPPASVPEFVRDLEIFPYTNGQRFVQALQARGGEAAVDAAFRSPPVSTEQVLHPERYPGDLPVPVNVADLAARLGPGWKDVDEVDVGEEFLLTMLGLRLDPAQAELAATGWGGGRYRAWSDGARTAVLMSTTWDTAADESGFASAMRTWLGDRVGQVRTRGLSVDVLFASDAPTLALLERAAG